jgi:putative endonuclease
MNFSVYILKSELTDVYYIGSTQNVQERLNLHNSAKARWTKRHQPWVLEYYEEFTTRSEAVRREKYFKSLKGIKRHLELLKAAKSNES